MTPSRQSYVERCGDGRQWQIFYPTGDEGMDTCRGPFLTRTGARFARWLEGGR